MIKLTALFIAALLALGVALGARAAPFTINGQSFPTREAAIAAYQHQIDADLILVSPVSDKIHGKLLVVLPTRDSLIAYVARTVAAGNDEEKAMVADMLSIQLESNAQALSIAAFFDRVSTSPADDGESHPSGGNDFVLFTQREGNGPLQWRLRRPEGAFAPLTLANNSKLNRVDQWNAFNGAVVNAAAQLGALPPRPAAPPAAAAPVAPGKPVVTNGTGFFVDEAGHAITAAHVVEGCKALHARLTDGSRGTVGQLAIDRDKDLALLMVARIPPAIAPLGARPIKAGEPVVVYGFPLSGALSSQGNLVTGVVSALSGLRDDPRNLQITAPIQQGNSGGPLLDEQGAVIGVVTAKINALNIAKTTGDIPQNVNFAIKSNLLMQFLDSNTITYQRLSSTHALRTVEIGEKAMQFTFMVTCDK
jgi:S1-C subfamily serine protease